MLDISTFYRFVSVKKLTKLCKRTKSGISPYQVKFFWNVLAQGSETGRSTRQTDVSYNKVNKSTVRTEDIQGSRVFLGVAKRSPRSNRTRPNAPSVKYIIAPDNEIASRSRPVLRFPQTRRRSKQWFRRQSARHFLPFHATDAQKPTHNFVY